MKRCDLPAAMFVQGWLMILAGMHRNLTDDALHTAICRTVLVVSTNPRFEVNEDQATEIVGLQLVALTDQRRDSAVRAFAERCLEVMLSRAVSQN